MTQASSSSGNGISEGIYRRLPFVLAAAVTALGALIVVAWFEHWTSLIQIVPNHAPMKFNTALGLFFSGAAMMLLLRGRKRLTQLTAFIPVIIGLLTLAEYVSGKNLRFDQLFINDYIQVATSVPGRMSPLAATCFLFFGTSLVLAGTERRKNQALVAGGLLSCIVAVVAIVGLFGYFTGIEVAYGWGAYTRMAAHTAFCFLALSLGLLAWVYQATQKSGINFLRWLPVTGSLTLMGMIAFISIISFEQLKTSLGWRKHTYDVLMTAQAFFGDLFSAQRGMRNFVLTSQTSALDVYESGVSNAPLRLAQLTTLTRDNPTQQVRLKTLQADLGELLEYSNELIKTRKTEGLQPAIKIEGSGRGFGVINQTLYDLQQFNDEENRLLDDRSMIAEADFQDTARLLVFGSVLAAGLLVFANWMVSREMGRRRRAELMQQRLAVELKGLIESSGEGIYGIDVQGRCTFINAVGRRSIGYETFEILGKNMHELIHHSRANGSHYPVEECPIVLAFKSDLSCRVDSEVFWRKDGSSFMVEYTAFPIVEENTIKGAVVTFDDISERKRYEAEREKLIADLQQALAEVKTLSGFIPICGWCKKIRSDTGFWQNVEQYIRSRTDVTFSHGICPDCSKKFQEDVSRINPSRPGN